MSDYGSSAHLPEWSVALFAARESSAVCIDVVRAVVDASAGRRTRIDLLINGNRSLAFEVARDLESVSIAEDRTVCVRVWFIELGDKAHAWNVYVHQIYGDAALVYFVDGYARPDQDAFRQLALSLDSDAHALAASGVPSCGRSAQAQQREMLSSGGIHGNLFTLTRVAMEQIRQRGFRLPMGLYRTDALIGAALNFGFDPTRNRWDSSRTRVQPTATWKFEPLHLWRLTDILVHLKRKGRQLQGELENLAVRDHLAVRHLPLERLPSTIGELVNAWWAGESGPRFWQLMRHPGWLYAIRRFSAPRDWSAARSVPLEIYRSDG